MLVVSALPIYPEGSPLSIEVMEETRLVAEALCRDDRVLLHAQALPNVGPLSANLEAMEAVVHDHTISAWKVFTHFPDLYEHDRNAWWLDDHEGGVPQVGEAFIAKALDLGVSTICAHKGFSGGSAYASPTDIGPAARKHPEANFVVYHSGFEARIPEGPYTQELADIGVNRLITSMSEAGIGPNENVYAELGSTWWYVMRYPTQAAHVLGKLLTYVGEDNVVWGTDCLFYGSPQDQIPQAHGGDQGQDPGTERGPAVRHRSPRHQVRVHQDGARRDPPGAPAGKSDVRSRLGGRGAGVPCPPSRLAVTDFQTFSRRAVISGRRGRPRPSSFPTLGRPEEAR
jgi:hypothetical protein